MVTAMTRAVRRASRTIPPEYKKVSYWLVRQNRAKIPSSDTAPTRLSTRRALGVTGANLRLRGSTMASAAPMRRAKTRVSVPS